MRLAQRVNFLETLYHLAAGIPGIAFLTHHTTRSDEYLPIALADFVLLQRTPRITTPIDNAITCDRHVLQVLAKNRRHRFHRLLTFDIEYGQRIQFEVPGKLDERAAFEMKVYFAPEPDGPGKPDP